MTSRRPPYSRSRAQDRASAERRLRRFGWLLALARGAVAWEQIWPVIWPVTGIAGLFLALALFGLLPALPAWLHLAILLGFLAALGFGIWRAVRAITLPDELAGKRRLERDSDLTHRPLTTLDDRMMTGHRDPEATALWKAHKQRAILGLGALRVRAPRPGLARLDPWALRGLLLLLILVAFASSDGQVSGRLASAMLPQFSGKPELPPSLDAWINPPTYTGQAPLYLDAGTQSPESLRVPRGSVLLAQVQGGGTAPSLKVDEAAEAFEPFAQDAYRLERQLTEGSRVTIEQNGRSLADWPLEVIPDNPPSIVFESAPGRTERSALSISYQADDDYGVVTAKAVITRIDKPEEPAVVIDLVIPGAAPKMTKANTYRDLTPHPWAGIAVEIQLTASDHLGQEGRSDVLRTVLPERIFNHPVARALVELRKQLTLKPDARLPVVQSLNQLHRRPDHFFHDIVVALAIRSAERRLIYDSTKQAVSEVQQLLWDTALHIEEGELAIAERELREAQDALIEALERGASDEEIQRLMDELQAALNNFLDELAQQMREQMARGMEPGQELPPNTQLLDRQDLQEMIERARELAQSGARDAARELLSQLRDMLENLTANPYAGQMNQDMQDASRMMENLENMMREQQELLDRSFERSQRGRQQNGMQGQQGQQGQGQPSPGPLRDELSDAQRQEELRRSLGELMRQLGDAMGDIPRPLGRAEREMRDARDALQNQQSSQAIPPQTRSLDQLQQGMRATLERFMEMFSDQPGQTSDGSVSGRPGQANRDPLGRGRNDPSSMSNSDLGEGVDIPSEMELQRSREIVDELRRRRGERSRPPVELDYIDRLLKQF